MILIVLKVILKHILLVVTRSYLHDVRTFALIFNRSSRQNGNGRNKWGNRASRRSRSRANTVGRRSRSRDNIAGRRSRSRVTGRGCRLNIGAHRMLTLLTTFRSLPITLLTTLHNLLATLRILLTTLRILLTTLRTLLTTLLTTIITLTLFITGFLPPKTGSGSLSQPRWLTKPLGLISSSLGWGHRNATLIKSRHSSKTELQ